MEQSLFEKYGGFATIHKVVEHFYDGVLDNDILSPHFESVDMSQLIDQNRPSRRPIEERSRQADTLKREIA